MGRAADKRHEPGPDGQSKDCRRCSNRHGRGRGPRRARRVCLGTRRSRSSHRRSDGPRRWCGGAVMRAQPPHMTTPSRRYNTAYTQCMYSKGNQVPGAYRPVSATPPPPVRRGKQPPPLAFASPPVCRPHPRHLCLLHPWDRGGHRLLRRLLVPAMARPLVPVCIVCGPMGLRRHRGVPSVIVSLPAGWRSTYHGYRPIPHAEFHNNWQRWERERHWERH